MSNNDLSTQRLAAEDDISTEIDHSLAVLGALQQLYAPAGGCGDAGSCGDARLESSLGAVMEMLKRARAAAERLHAIGNQIAGAPVS